jgi:hypothetical protein
MQCCFCGKYAEDIEEAIDDGWYPDFWHLEINYQGPICPDCQWEHLETDTDGEFILKKGHTLPSSADPMVSVGSPKIPDITCLYCGKTVPGIEPFCPSCKLEHFMLNEAGEEILKPGHEIPSSPLSELDDPPTPDLRPKFELGQIVGTPAALEAISAAGQTSDFFISKHVMGDWGEVCTEDKLLNDQAVVTGERILSAYRTLLGIRLWIITEAVGDDGHRAATTTILPEQY